MANRRTPRRRLAVALLAGVLGATGVGTSNILAATRAAANTSTTSSVPAPPSVGSPGVPWTTGQVVDLVSRSDGRGYWVVLDTGEVRAAGTAPSITGRIRSGATVVGAAPAPRSGGLWVLDRDGSVDALAGAPAIGNGATGRLWTAIVADPTGTGYWLIDALGRVQAVGSADTLPPVAGVSWVDPLVAGAATPDGRGLWLATKRGIVHALGSAPRLPSLLDVTSAIVDLDPAPGGRGVWAVLADGRVRPTGEATRLGGNKAWPEMLGAIALAPHPAGGYWLADKAGQVRAHPRSAAAPVPPSYGPHTFLLQDRFGRPGRFDPCTPVRWRVDYRGAHAGAKTDVPEAIARLAVATGLTMQFDQTAVGQPAAYPVIEIAWRDRAIGPGPVGVGGAAATVTTDGRLRIVRGTVGVYRQASLVSGFGTGRSLGNVLLHELAHAVGLAHVTDTRQVMNGYLSAIPGYGAGDREGLWRVGAALGCLPQSGTGATRSAQLTSGDGLLTVWCPISRSGEPSRSGA